MEWVVEAQRHDVEPVVGSLARAGVKGQWAGQPGEVNSQ